MYAAYFGLKSAPFSIAPDPRYLFMSERHREALAHLVYGLGGGGGFVLLSGEIGTGKTTVCRLFLEQIPADCNVAYIFNPKLTVAELLQSICEEFHIEAGGTERTPTVKTYVDALNAFLLAEYAAGRNNVLIIDEAQNLSPEVLEQLRLLTNLETRERKLLQVVLIGQPELRAMLARPELEQLAQRVIARYHLDAMTPAETGQYIRHRLDVAGLERPMPFERKALDRIHHLSRGVPRRVNLLCDRALLGAFANSKASVDRDTVDQAAVEVFGAAPRDPRRDALVRPLLVLALGLAGGAGLYAAAHRWSGPQPAAGSPVAAASGPMGTASGARAAQPAAAPVAAATASAPAPTLHRDISAAWRELATAWKAEVGEGEPCRQLARDGLHCFSRSMNLAVIRELGRPGILTLDAATGTRTYAVLASLTRDSATLRAAGTEQVVTLPALAARWQGEFSTLWRAPPGYGGTGELPVETVAWVAARLAQLDGQPAPSGVRVVDPAMRAQLRAFQLANGLPGDGYPGPMTFMQINRASGIDEPRLRTSS